MILEKERNKEISNHLSVKAKNGDTKLERVSETMAKVMKKLK